MNQAYYNTSIDLFLNTKDEEIIGRLNLAGTKFSSQWTITTTSWESSIQILKNCFQKLVIDLPLANAWHILFEYEIPRLLGRIDIVIIAEDLIFAIEFKYDRKSYELADIRQAEDYAIDLRDFHLASRDKTIIPILLAPLANPEPKDQIRNHVPFLCLKTNAENLHDILNRAYIKYHDHLAETINVNEWEHSDYNPSPSILQAAKALFANQKVENITKKGAKNLNETINAVVKIINDAKEKGKKVICFVTGVPGAGKTLVGLKVIHHEGFNIDDFKSAYFSGNGPLIKVLREALARDHYEEQITLYKNGKLTERPRKENSNSAIQAKIQNLHQFIKDGIRKVKPLTERVVVFDEAQRCWNAKHFKNKAKQNRNRETTPFLIEEKSEAELLFEFLSRREGWSVIIALVGGGQEINTGEGGITEWGKAIRSKFNNWEVHISNELLIGDSSTADQKLFETYPNNVCINENSDLHLNVSERTFRASNLNAWVNAVLDNDEQSASNILSSMFSLYPVFITRDIHKAKNWLRSQKRGTRRYGLIASSGGLRLKPEGIYVKQDIDEALWFLNDENDIRSSYYLEFVATEYEMQGLELDWTCVCWDADLRRSESGWDFKSFNGKQWSPINGLDEQRYLLNTYRVLLTRAREGMVIFIPFGDKRDHTRPPEYYDPIFDYLKSCGVSEI